MTIVNNFVQVENQLEYVALVSRCLIKLFNIEFQITVLPKELKEVGDYLNLFVSLLFILYVSILQPLLK